MNYLGNGELIHTPFNDRSKLSLKGVNARYSYFFNLGRLMPFTFTPRLSISWKLINNAYCNIFIHIRD